MNRQILTFILFVIATNLYSQNCNDGILNGFEIDIDCGGDCPLCPDGLVSGQMITEESTSVYPYQHALWLPRGYEENNPYRKLPLIVFLHGTGGWGKNTSQIQAYGPMNYRNNSWWNFPFIIANPIQPSGNWQPFEIRDFIDLLIQNYQVDASRIYVTGTSLGSYGLSFFSAQYPEYSAAIASFAFRAPDLNNSNCDEYKGTPLWYFHNLNDGTVDLEEWSSVDDIGLVHENCGDPSPDPYTYMSIFENGGHNSWSKVYNPYLNENNGSYSSQYDLADVAFLGATINYNTYQTSFGLPNGIASIYEWFLNYENIPNSCRNQTQDGDETGVDCGGSCKPCTASYECHNGVLDAGETAIDCGGGCPPCERALLWRNTTWNNTTGPIETDNAIVLENYSGGFSTKSLYIETGAIFTVSGTLEVKEDLDNNGTLIVPSGASLITYEGFNTSSNIIFQKNTRYADGRYSFVGSPVKQGAATIASLLGDHTYTYNEALSPNSYDLNRWVSTAGSEELIPGKGYTQANQQLIAFVGSPNTGSITINASHENDGWHLVSNPYPAAIDIDDFIDGNPNISGSIYLWDDNGSNTGRGSSNDYIIANKVGATDLNGVDNSSAWNGRIGSFQGFFVQLNGAPGDIYFTESMRVSGNNSEDNFFRKSEIPRLSITLEHNDLRLRTMIASREDAGLRDMISGYDALVFDASSENGIYSVKNGQLLGIQTISPLTAEIPLQFSLSANGIASIRFATENWRDDFYLVDNVDGIAIQIENNTVYSFTTNSGILVDRFMLVKAENILRTAENSIRFYTYQSTLFINAEANKPTNLQVFDLNGKLQKQIKARGFSKIDLSYLPSGIYVISDGRNKSKVLLK